jgi:hypothetical protein
MNARKWVNIQGDREFHALSEYVIAFFKIEFYDDEKIKKLILSTLKKFCLGES